jgi:AcrR family transcriptional regulator
VRPAPRSAQERRQELLDATRRAIRALGPSVAMDEIAAEAGITKPILYRHFESRAGLATAIASDYATAFLAHVTARIQGAATAADLVRAVIDAFVEFVERDPELFAFISDEHGFGRLAATGHAVQSHRPLQRGLAFALRNALESQGRDAAPAATWGPALSGMLASATRWWLEERSLPRDELVRHLFELVWHGVTGQGGGAAAQRAAGERSAGPREAGGGAAAQRAAGERSAGPREAGGEAAAQRAAGERSAGPRANPDRR